MSGLFSAPKMPAAPGPDPELLRRQQDQEARLEAQERQSAEEIAARKRARRSALRSGLSWSCGTVAKEEPPPAQISAADFNQKSLILSTSGTTIFGHDHQLRRGLWSI